MSSPILRSGSGSTCCCPPEGCNNSAVAGVSGGALLVAGGANFPDKKPWQGGTKVWYDTVFVLDEPGTTVPTIGDFDGASDRLELRYEAAPDEPEPVVTLDHAEDGATVIRLDGEAVGRLLNAQGLRVEDIALSRLDPAR